MDRVAILQYYLRPEIVKSLYKNAHEREVAIAYPFGYGKRPDAFFNEQDIIECVKKGAMSFHCSEEIWDNPLDISSSLSKQEINEMKKGWDLIIDIDTPHFFYAKIATKLILDALQYHGVESASVKFSGNKGFHIGVPFEAFPRLVHGTETRLLFPDGARKIALYLREMIRPHLLKALEQEGMAKIEKNTGIPESDLKEKGLFDPFKVVDIDTILISHRHLCRMAYSLHEKSGLVSLPLDIKELDAFKREDASPEKVSGGGLFLNKVAREGEAADLFVAAFDTSAETLESEMYTEVAQGKKKEYEEMTEAIAEVFFPPCIKKILEGMKDGKKRALFILLTFLANAGWDKEQIIEKVKEWNKKNPQPLKESYLQGQLTYIGRLKGKLPPNYSNTMYYQDLGLLSDSEKQSKIKNPLNYARRQYFIHKNSSGKEKKEIVEKPMKKSNESKIN